MTTRFNLPTICVAMAALVISTVGKANTISIHAGDPQRSGVVSAESRSPQGNLTHDLEFPAVDTMTPKLLSPEISQATVAATGLVDQRDLGNITSDGSGGRQIHVRHLEAEDVGQLWKFYPPHDWFPESYLDPTPATPAQADTRLTAGSPLLLVLPQLAHWPSDARVDVSHLVDGQEITVDASMRFSGLTLTAIFGPHEYLHPIGPLDAGQYRLTLNISEEHAFPFIRLDPLSAPRASESALSFTTAYIDFVVHPVPEPSASLFVSTSVLLLAGAFRRGRR